MKTKIISHRSSTIKKSLLLISTLTASLLLPLASAQAAEGSKREGFNEPFVLAGLKELKVVVGKLDAFATAGGESEEHIRHLITESLAPAHITLLEGEADCVAGKGDTKSQGCGPTDTPLLYTKVRVIPDGGASKGAAYSVSLALVEKAKIARNKKDLMVSVWTKEVVGRLTEKTKDTIDQQVESVLKDFHRDYMLANSADSSKDVPEEAATKATKKHKGQK